VTRVPLRGVYIILHTASQQGYVGCSDDVESRWRSHLLMLASGSHPSRALQRLWQQDGRDAFRFTILEVDAPHIALRPREELWMRVYDGRLLNSMPGNRHGAESRANMSEAAIEAWERRHQLGTDSLSLEARREIARTTRQWARQLVVRAQKHLIAKRTNAAANFRTPEAIVRNAAALRGVPKSPSHRAAMKATHTSGTCRCHPRKETS
jgi:GIY-YIG catalytic domain